jgi:hypothetical protein
MNEKVDFKGTFASLISPLLIGKKIRSTTMVDFNFEKLDKSDNPTIIDIPNKIITINSIEVEGNYMWINDRYCLEIDDRSIIEIIE